MLLMEKLLHAHKEERMQCYLTILSNHTRWCFAELVILALDIYFLKEAY